MEILINIDVDALDRAALFYTTVFGLKLGRRLGKDGLELLGSPSPIYLLRKADGSQATPRSEHRHSYGRHWTPVHLDFVVNDIETILAQALNAGASLEKPVQISSWGKPALLADPFGHGLCLVEFTGRGYDEIASPGEG